MLAIHLPDIDFRFWHISMGKLQRNKRRSQCRCFAQKQDFQGSGKMACCIAAHAVVQIFPLVDDILDRIRGDDGVASKGEFVHLDGRLDSAAGGGL